MNHDSYLNLKFLKRIPLLFTFAERMPMKKSKIFHILLTIILVTLQSDSNPKIAPAISMKETHVRESYPGVPSLLSLVILSWLLVLDPSRGLLQVTRHWVTQERNHVA